MKFLIYFQMAISSLISYKMRSILTILGIVIGVASVVIIIAIGNAGEQSLTSQITGSNNTLEIYYQPTDEELSTNPNAMFEPVFKKEDIEALKKINGVEKVVAVSRQSIEASYNNSTTQANIIGIDESYMEVNKANTINGVSFSNSDFIKSEKVTLISEATVERLFATEDPVGEIIWVANQPLKVIGVKENSKGLLAQNSIDIYIPTKTYRTIFNDSNISEVSVKTSESADINSLSNNLIYELNSLNNTEDSYQILNIEEVSNTIESISNTMTLIIGSIAGISLLVGGIGVMNMMLVSVTERTREIGLRKAVGATKPQILIQFLIEAVCMTLTGGIVGLFLGWCVSFAISILLGGQNLISWFVILLVVAFSGIIGIVFGILPANKAASLKPIDSLRYE